MNIHVRKRIPTKTNTTTNTYIKPKKYLTRSQAIDWLNKNATFGQKDVHFDKKIMKHLDSTCRLMPMHGSFFNKKYSLDELKWYARDTRPH